MESRSRKQNQLWTVIKGVKKELSEDWLPDITMTIIGASFGGVVGYLMNSHKGIIIGAAVGLTVAIWVIAYLMIRHIPAIEQPDPPLPAQTAQQESAKTSEITQATRSPVPEPAKPAAAPRDVPVKKEPQVKKDRSTPTSISQAMNNSPGGIQNIGGTVTVNQAPPSRSFTTEQQKALLAQLAQWPPVTFTIIATTGDSEIQMFADEIKILLMRAGWMLESAGQFFPTGDRPVGVIITVNNQSTAPKGARGLQQGLESFGYKAPGLIDASLADNTIRIIVGHRK